MANRVGQDMILSKVGDHANNVTIGKDIQINLPDGERLDTRLARLEVRLATVERGQSNVSWALLIIALALVAQTIWGIQSQNSSYQQILEKLSDTQRRVIRLEAIWSSGAWRHSEQGTPAPADLDFDRR
jgi:hypothetical protein